MISHFSLIAASSLLFGGEEGETVDHKGGAGWHLPLTLRPSLFLGLDWIVPADIPAGSHLRFFPLEGQCLVWNVAATAVTIAASVSALFVQDIDCLIAVGVLDVAFATPSG